jgi:hypothetical protein
MPRVVNPNAVANSLPGRIQNLKAVTGDIKGKARNAFNSLTVGVGGLIVSGATQLAGGITGGLAVTGNVTVAGNVTATSSTVTATAVVGSDLYTLNGPSFNITGTRVACWLETATGRVAMATSSRRFKENEVTVTDVDPRAIIGVKMKYWNYITEVRKRDDPTFEEYVGPDYHVATNFGPIAEDLHDAGLWMCVVYERDEGGTLKLDGTGNPIPYSIHDALFAYVEHLAVQWLMSRVDDHEARLAAAGL